MAKDPNERDSKIIQFLAEAHSKEAALEAALADHITRTPKDAYRKRLQEHLKETNRHKKQVEKRIKQLGGTGAVQGLAKTAGEAVGKASSAVKAIATTAREVSPLAPSEPEVMLKNAQIQYREEADEIAIYKTIQAFAEKVGDKDTAKLAKGILREEERMAKYVASQIEQLSGSVVQAVVPRDQRSGTTRRRKRSASSSRKSSASSSRKSSSKSGSSRSKASSSSRSRSASSKSKPKASASTRSRGSSKTASARKSGGTAKRSGGAKKASGGTRRASASRRKSS
jgi:ferritin-like metal-binding protein YciE